MIFIIPFLLKVLCKSNRPAHSAGPSHSCDLLVRLGRLLDSTWASLGHSRGGLGAVLDRLGAVLGALGVVGGRLVGNILRALGVARGNSRTTGKLLSTRQLLLETRARLQ